MELQREALNRITRIRPISVIRFGNISGHKVSIIYSNSIVNVPQGELIDRPWDSCGIFPDNSITVVYDDTLSIRHFYYQIMDTSNGNLTTEVFPPYTNTYALLPNYFHETYVEGDKAIFEYIFTPYDYLNAVLYQDSLPPAGAIY